MEAFRVRLHEPEGHDLRERLGAWAEQISLHCSSVLPDMPAEVTDRDADVWEPLLSIADAAGHDWLSRARIAAVALVADAKRKPPSLGVRLLSYLRKEFGDREQMATEEVLTALCTLDEAPWSDIKGKAIDARTLSRLLGDYEIKSTTIRIGGSTPKGYRRIDLHDAWVSYLPEQPEESGTSARAATDADPDEGGWIDYVD